MAVNKENENPIYEILKVEDIETIPDEHIREFACDIFKAYMHISEMLKPFGLKVGMGKFQPNGLGEVSYNVKFYKKDTK